MSPQRTHCRRGTVVALYTVISTVLLSGCGAEPKPVGRPAAVDSYVKAVVVYHTGDTDKAIAALKDAVAQHDDLTMAHQMLGDLYQKKHNFAAALQQYQITTKLDPYGYENYYREGLMLQLLNRAQESIAAYLRALKLNPIDFNTNLNLAAAYLGLGQAGDAMPYAKKATELNDKSASAWSNFAVSLDMQKKYAEAEDAFRKSIELDSKPEVAVALADNYVHQRKFKEARSVMDQVLPLQNSPYNRKRLADVMFLQKDYDGAVQEYYTALKLDEHYYPALNEIGWVSITQYNQSLGLDEAKRQGALDAWRKSLLINPQQPRVAQLMQTYSQKFSDERP